MDFSSAFYNSLLVLDAIAQVYVFRRVDGVLSIRDCKSWTLHWPLTHGRIKECWNWFWLLRIRTKKNQTSQVATRKVLIKLGRKNPKLHNRELQHWNRVSREVVVSLLFELFKACLDRPWATQRSPVWSRVFRLSDLQRFFPTKGVLQW